MLSTPGLPLSALVRRVVTSAVTTATIPISQGSRRNARQAVSVDRMRARARAEALHEFERFHSMRQPFPALVGPGASRVGNVGHN